MHFPLGFAELNAWFPCGSTCRCDFRVISMSVCVRVVSHAGVSFHAISSLSSGWFSGSCLVSCGRYG